MSETTSVVTPLINAIRALGISAERTNPGRKRSSGGSNGWSKGAADIVGWIAPTGRMYALECKRPGARPRKDQAHQRAWLDSAERDGVLVGRDVTSVEVGLTKVREWAAMEAL